LLVSSCAWRHRAEAGEREAPARQPESATREVRSGDTLYSIAWESGRDYRELAAWNDIDPPYLIKPGQVIRLHPSAADQVTAGATYTVKRGDTLYAIARARGVRYQDLAAWNGIKRPYVLRPGQELRVAAPVSKAPTRAPLRVDTPKVRAVPDDDDTTPAGGVNWAWPTEGTVTARFAPNGTNKGIDIAGATGQPVRAAAPGKVVYQGSGLRGYGQLIIVKHNSDFLSAYAHCATIYAKEASVIKPGQVICTMGSSGTDRVKLHFEIRRRGVPVDPMEYLPKK
jgi:lipoprotein NlpD